MHKGHIFFISGPSGVGKGTVIDHLRTTRPDILFPPSCTTRAPRPGEIPGETYIFLSNDEFDAMEADGKFLEWAWVHGKYRYGTLYDRLVVPAENGAVVIREFDVQGFTAAKEKLSADSYTSIFIAPDGDIEALKERIRERAPIAEEELENRMQSLQKELAQSKIYDHVVTSYHGEVDRLIADIEAIIQTA